MKKSKFQQVRERRGTQPREEILAKKREQFGRWYGVNREEHNKKRREKYANDPEFREKEQAAARERKRARTSHVEGQVVREFEGKQVTAYRIGVVAENIGRAVETIRAWEDEGVIPASIFEGKQRAYTATQVTLLKELAVAIDACGSNHIAMGEAKQKLRRKIFNNWKGGL